jgi:uncharacterized membrane protein YkoI
MTSPRLTPLVLIVSAAFACAGSSPKSPPATDAAVTEEEPCGFGQAAIPPDSAVAIAKGRVQGTILKGVLEREGGTLLYSFDIAVPGKTGITEVHVDAQSGAVLRVEEE